MYKYVQKNWTSLIDRSSGKLLLIYSFKPFVILQLSNRKDGQCRFYKRINKQNAAVGSIRGGTPFIKNGSLLHPFCHQYPKYRCLPAIFDPRPRDMKI